MTKSSAWLLWQLVISKSHFWAEETYPIIFDRKEKSWARSHSKITNSLLYFITYAQIGDMLLFCYGYETTIFHLLFFSLDNSNTIYYLEVAIHIFSYSVYHEIAYLPLSSENSRIIF